jgi:CHASE2 domain-containing sensor protein
MMGDIMGMQMKVIVTRLFLRLKNKGVRYWTTALIILFLTTTGSSYVYDQLHIREARSYFFQSLLEWGPRPPEPKFVRLVLIENDEYWQGYLAGRKPIKRDYLAQLVDKLASDNVHVIALDFDARLPNPASMKIPEEYQNETNTLIQAIENAAEQGKKVVLATPISLSDGQYQQDSDIYQSHGLCNRRSNRELRDLVQSPEVEQPAKQKNITCGYIALPYDPLIIPGPLLMADGSYLDSFAVAVARAEQPELVARLLERIGARVRYGNYISGEKFRQSNAVFSAHAVLHEMIDKETLEAKAVIVGADWSRDALDRGPRADLHPTPVGSIVGAMLHANFVEAVLDTRIFGATPEWVLVGTEIIFSLIAGVAFALIPSVRGKIAGIFSLLFILFFVQWLVLHTLGIFFDSFVPVLGMGLHSLYERLVPHGTKQAQVSAVVS